MIKNASLFGYIPSTLAGEDQNVRHLAKFRDNVERAVDVNNILVQKIWNLKIQAAKARTIEAKTMLQEEATRLEDVLNASQAQIAIETAIKELNEMEFKLTSKDESNNSTSSLRV